VREGPTVDKTLPTRAELALAFILSMATLALAVWSFGKDPLPDDPLTTSTPESLDAVEEWLVEQSRTVSE
jgi:hypothetical protein